MLSVLKKTVRALFLFSITLLSLIIQAVFKALFNPSSIDKTQPMRSDIHYDYQEKKYHHTMIAQGVSLSCKCKTLELYFYICFGL